MIEHPLAITELLDWLEARITAKQWDALQLELGAHVEAIRNAHLLVQAALAKHHDGYLPGGRCPTCWVRIT